MYRNIQRLLRKMVQGQSTESEEKEIRQWFTAPDTGKLSQEEEQLKKEIWKAITKEGIPDTGKPLIRVVPLYKKIIPYAAAVCLLLGFVAGFDIVCRSLSSDDQIAYNNARSEAPKQIQTAKMEFTLLPESKVKAAYSVCKNEAEIIFSGDIAFTNKLNRNTRYTIKTAGGTVRELTLKRNTAYYIFISKDETTGKEKINLYDKHGVLLYYDYERVPRDIFTVIMNT